MNKEKNLLSKYDELIACLERAEELSERLVSGCIFEKIKMAKRQTIEEMVWFVNMVYGKK